MQIRLGVIGLGDSWERRYKPALLRLSEKFDIRAVYDEVSYRARVQAAELECDVADGFTCLAERDDVDAVYILGASWFGIEPLQAACRARKAIFLGRAIGVDTPWAEEALQAVQSSGIRFMVEFPWRFYPATIRLMELLASGLGSPQLAFCEQQALELDRPPGAARPEAESSILLLHSADWLRFVFGREPSKAFAAGCSLGAGPSRGFESLVARFGDAAAGQATVRRLAHSQWSEAAAYRRPCSFQVVAQFGMAFLEMPGEITWFDQSGRHDETHDIDRPLGEIMSDRFYRIVRHGLNPSPGLADAMAARQMVLDARQAETDPIVHASLAHRTAG